GSLRDHQSRRCRSALRYSCRIEGAESGCASVVCGIARHDPIDQRAVVGGISSNPVESIEKTSLGNARNRSKNINLVHVVSAKQVNGMLSDVVYFDDVLL